MHETHSNLPINLRPGKFTKSLQIVDEKFPERLQTRHIIKSPTILGNTDPSLQFRLHRQKDWRTKHRTNEWQNSIKQIHFSNYLNQHNSRCFQPEEAFESLKLSIRTFHQRNSKPNLKRKQLWVGVHWSNNPQTTESKENFQHSKKRTGDKTTKPKIHQLKKKYIGTHNYIN